MLYYVCMKKIIVSSIFMSAFILLGSVYQASALANPASVKCAADGGKSVIKKDATGGEYSDCTFPNGAVCEEWAYYRGECSAKAVNTLDQLPSSCTSAYDGCNNCSRTSGSEWACTMMACIDVKQPAVTCTGYTKTDDKPAICTKEYMPVCGQPKMPECKDGMMCAQVMPAQKTYSNTCMMKADGATLVSEGACGDQGQKICTMEYAPVCGRKIEGKEGTTAAILKTKTYSNTCMMKVDEATLVHNGECVETEVTKPPFCSDLDFKKLKRGSRGKNVRALQMHFARIGLIKIESVDGIYGAKLGETVKKFQRDAGLKPDGIFGNGSRAKICNS